MNRSRFKKFTIASLIILMCTSFFLAACKSEEAEEAELPPPPSDPLTGALVEDGFDEGALNRRTVAFVVENAPDARPQWGMDDEQYAPDVVLQGEVEGGITRTLWLYSDYNKLPDQIGPMRSARPPFIKFSELFDSVFIHWGQSSSKGEYVGANTVFRKDKVDHINQMTMDDPWSLFDRDNTRAVSSEHTGILYGAKVADAIKNEGFRTEPKDYTKLYFYDDSTPVSTDTAAEVNVIYSEQADWETTDWTYNEEDEKYHCSSFENDFVRDNLLVLYDDTEYIAKENYQGKGYAVVYCNYKFAGGRAQLFTKGSVKELKWERKAGKLILIDPDYDAAEVLAVNSDDDEENDIEGVILAEIPLTDEEMEEAEQKAAEAEEAGEDYQPEMYVVQPLNKGKTWIGWVSSNNGGKVNITPGSYTITIPDASSKEAADTAEGE